MLKNYIKDELEIKIFATREEMGADAAKDIKEAIKELLKIKKEIGIIFAAAPSQNDVLAALVNDKEIEWERINAFHMDEYVGISKDAPQGFANFLKNAIFDKVPFKSVNLIDCENDPDAEAERYSKLLEKSDIDIVCMGIGENGHIAFNDPHVADFNDKKLVKKVSLDETCRNQQVHDGCFDSLEKVPKYALTLTVPMLKNTKYHFCVVPAETKANAVYNTICGEIGEWCPATCLRITKGSKLYLDADSAAKII